VASVAVACAFATAGANATTNMKQKKTIHKVNLFVE
jgi:hypothetical protein